MTPKPSNVNWNYPTNIRQGVGRVSELADVCYELTMQNPLLVTDPGLAKSPMVQQAHQGCVERGLSCAIFSNVISNPTGENVQEGVDVFRQGQHDGVIAFGGGSALDAGKAIALMAGQDRPMWDFEDVGDNWTRVNADAIAVIIAVPTTAGTGSEVGRASVITDVQNHLKRIIFHPKMLPSIVILDPELTVGLPPHLTAATGMDALSHALEAYCSNYFHPMAEGIAIEAIRLVKEHLPAATQDGQNLDARTQLMVASTMGATAFQRGLGAMHALAHSLGALYNSHHGLLNAILMPYVLKANRPAIESRICRLARYIELPQTDFDGFVQWVLDLRAELGIANSLSEIGIDDSQIHTVAEMAVNDPSAGGNPILFSTRQYADIFSASVAGI